MPGNLAYCGYSCHGGYAFPLPFILGFPLQFVFGGAGCSWLPIPLWGGQRTDMSSSLEFIIFVASWLMTNGLLFYLLNRKVNSVNSN